MLGCVVGLSYGVISLLSCGVISLLSCGVISLLSWLTRLLCGFIDWLSDRFIDLLIHGLIDTSIHLTVLLLFHHLTMLVIHHLTMLVIHHLIRLLPDRLIRLLPDRLIRLLPNILISLSLHPTLLIPRIVLIPVEVLLERLHPVRLRGSIRLRLPLLLLLLHPVLPDPVVAVTFRGNHVRLLHRRVLHHEDVGGGRLRSFALVVRLGVALLAPPYTSSEGCTGDPNHCGSVGETSHGHISSCQGLRKRTLSGCRSVQLDCC